MKRSPTKSRSPRRAAGKRVTHAQVVAPTPGVDAEVFVEAARRIAQGESTCCCLSVQETLTDRGVAWMIYSAYPENRFFATVLEPQSHRGGNCWYAGCVVPGEGSVQLARTLGLLLCAELVREGFVPEGWMP